MAIDGGTLSGYAHVVPGAPKPAIGLVKMPDTKFMGRFCGTMVDWLVPFAQLTAITEFAVEMPIIVQHKDQSNGGACPHCGRMDTSLNAREVDRVFGIVHAVEMAADRLGIPCRRMARGTVVKHIAGTGRGNRHQFKQYCLLGCQRKGWNITSEDVADAAATLDCYCSEEKIQVGWDTSPAPFPLFEGPPGVRIDRGNEIAASVLVNRAMSFDAGKG